MRFHTLRNLIFRLPFRHARGIIAAMQRKTGISGRGPAKTAAAKAAAKVRAASAAGSAATACTEADAKASDGHSARAAAADGGLSAWLARYEPVEREVIEAHERRLASRVRNDARRREEDARAFGDLCEATEGFAVVWRREGWSVRDMVRWADGDVLTLLALARWLRGEAATFIDRAQSRLRRPLYYARERTRREALAEERRRTGGRRTTNPCPTREEILEAWVHRRDSHAAAVRFGSMVHDLECYVDNSLLRDEAGAIVGRRGGVKAWLQENIPALYVRYTTVMRYKAMAKKLRQVVGLADPVPAEAVLAEPPRDGVEEKQDYGTYEISGQGRERPMDRQGHADTSKGAQTELPEPGKVRMEVPKLGTARMKVPDLAVVRARAVWLEVLAGIRGSPTALMERLDALTDPDRVEDANMLAGWRAKYENEITGRMKSRWWRRMVRRRDVG